MLVSTQETQDTPLLCYFFVINKQCMYDYEAQCMYDYEAQQPIVVFSMYQTDLVPPDRSLIMRNSTTLIPYFPLGTKYINTFTDTITNFIDHPNHA